MTPNGNNPEEFDFSIDGANLYREENFSDLGAASIRKMVPVTPAGADDPSRSPLYLGSLQIMTPQGPFPIQARLMANSLEEALEVYPRTMEAAMEAVMAELQKYEAETRKKDDSRIIVPGR